jgi:carbon-monoxide dehydrogenase iron sulfur subunit
MFNVHRSLYILRVGVEEMKRIIAYPERCTGCRLCESVCALYNERANDPSRSRIRIVKRHAVGLSKPMVCLQCKNPPCGKACPVEAIQRDSDGLVKVDYDLCIGCEACVSGCPFGVMMALEDKVVKCELCGGDPQCVKYCATAAIEYGDLEIANQRKRVKSANLPFVLEGGEKAEEA